MTCLEVAFMIKGDQILKRLAALSANQTMKTKMFTNHRDNPGLTLLTIRHHGPYYDPGSDVTASLYRCLLGSTCHICKRLHSI